MKRLFTHMAILFICGAFSASAADKKIVLIAGKQSHGPGDHEFRAGCLLLKKCLDNVPGLKVEMHDNGWPKNDSTAFDDADAVLIYADGGGGHPAFQGDHAQKIAALVKKGVGLGCAHFGVEVPAGDPGKAMQDWIGGYYEHQFSVNPMWKPEFKSFPHHPVVRGVKPFALLDEWYFNMRWRPDGKDVDASLNGAAKSKPAGLTPILVAKPSDKVRDGPYVAPQGPYKHIQEASGREETMMWAYERPDGGRGFGFTGGHKHVNWGNDNYRKVVLNALVWIAKADVPANGVESSVTPEEVTQNLDPKKEQPPVNVTGKWNFEVETTAGTGSPEFAFTHAGQNLIGAYKGRLGEAEVTGSIKNDEIKWSFDVTLQDQPMTCTYKGKIEGKDKMKGTVTLGEYEGTWTAKKE